MIIILSLIVAKVRVTPNDEPKVYTRCIMNMTKVSSTNNDHGGDDHDVDNRWKPMEAFFFPLPGLMKEVLSFSSLSWSSCPFVHFFPLSRITAYLRENWNAATSPLRLHLLHLPLVHQLHHHSRLARLSYLPKHIRCFLIPGAPTLDPELWTYSKQFYYEAGKDLART